MKKIFRRELTSSLAFADYLQARGHHICMIKTLMRAIKQIEHEMRSKEQANKVFLTPVDVALGSEF